MKKYLFIVLLVVWSCEDEKNETLINYTLVNFSSINNGDVLSYKPNSIILSFKDHLTENDFDADSYENYKSFYSGSLIPDSIDVDPDLLPNLVDNFFKVENSNFIKLNNQPQTFIYDSTTRTCLLTTFTSELYPDGNGEGLSLQEGENVLLIGAIDEINFSANQTYIDNINVVPNPWVTRVALPEGGVSERVRFINIPNNAIIDIFRVEDDYYVNRIFNDNQNDVKWWYLRNFNNSELSSGIYQYNFGLDTTNTGDLNNLQKGYFLIIHEED